MAPATDDPGGADQAGCSRSAQTRLRPAVVPRDGRVLQLRDLIFHHLDPDRRHSALRLWPQVRWPGHQHCRLAGGQPVHALCRCLHGGVGIGVSNGWWPVFLGISTWWPRLGLDHGLAQHDRPDHDYGGHQRRRGDLHHRSGHPDLQHSGRRDRTGLRFPHGLVLPALRDGADHDSTGADQRPWHSPHRETQRLQRLLAHRGRCGDRRAADLPGTAPQQPELPVLRRHLGQSTRRLVRRSGDGDAGAGSGLRELRLSFTIVRADPRPRGLLPGSAIRAGLPARYPAGPVDLYRLRRLRPCSRRDRDGPAQLCLGRVPFGGRFGRGRDTCCWWS